MATMAMPGIEIHSAGVDLAQKAVCIKVRLQRLGNTRKVSTSQVEVDTDKTLIRVSKHLIDSAELRQITNFDAEVRRYLYNTCLPFEVGIHLCPFALLEQVEGRLRKLAEDRQSLVAAFLSAYPALCQEAATRLRTLYNPQDYPPIDYVRGQFGFTWQYVRLCLTGRASARLTQSHRPSRFLLIFDGDQCDNRVTGEPPRTARNRT